MINLKVFSQRNCRCNDNFLTLFYFLLYNRLYWLQSAKQVVRSVLIIIALYKTAFLGIPAGNCYQKGGELFYSVYDSKIKVGSYSGDSCFKETVK